MYIAIYTITNKLIFSRKSPEVTYINRIKVPGSPTGALREFQDDVQLPYSVNCVNLSILAPFKMTSKTAAGLLSFIGKCVNWSILVDFSFFKHNFI